MFRFNIIYTINNFSLWTEMKNMVYYSLIIIINILI